MKDKKRNPTILLIFIVFLLFGFIIFLFRPFLSNNIEYSSLINKKNNVLGQEEKALKDNKTTNHIKNIITPIIVPVIHVITPKVVKAVYLSSWVAGSPKIANPIFDLVDRTELNTVVIDIKDSTGRVAFNIPNLEIQKLGSVQKRIPNIHKLIKKLHQKNIYVIGRISVFQDPYLTKVKPEWALKKENNGDVWKNYKGLTFLDPTNKKVGQYILDIALGSYSEGFDEINFDYVRYPSDGDISNLNYNLKKGQTRADSIENFFKFISMGMKKNKDIPISVDLFGDTTEVKNDMGIGQVWEKTIPYFDFISPMVYPSHYSTGHLGYKNPANYPYEVVLNALSNAINRTRKANQNINKIRPWLQDFNLGAIYNKDKVQAEIKAVDDLGLSSWMLWSSSNKYNNGALKLENNI